MGQLEIQVLRVGEMKHRDLRAELSWRADRRLRRTLIDTALVEETQATLAAETKPGGGNIQVTWSRYPVVRTAEHRIPKGTLTVSLDTLFEHDQF